MRKAIAFCVNRCYLKILLFCSIFICTGCRGCHLGGGIRVAVVIFIWSPSLQFSVWYASEPRLISKKGFFSANGIYVLFVKGSVCMPTA